jgi:hypothetical protein
MKQHAVTAIALPCPCVDYVWNIHLGAFRILVLACIFGLELAAQSK